MRALATAGSARGEEVQLLTTLEPGQPPIAGEVGNVALQVFPRMRPYALCRSRGLASHLDHITDDLVHHHSLWLLTLRYAHQAARRLGAPLVISPRGMLSGWAYEHRRMRKWFAQKFVHPGAMEGAAGWHATSPEECDDIRACGFRQPVCVSPNGVPVPADADLAAARATWHELCPQTRGRPVALFYSRLHRKKRVRELIDLWLAADRGDWLLLIVGVAEDYTAAELAARVRAAGAQGRVAVLDGVDRPPPYAVASVFVLPSHSENFGLVIAEALAAGVPALVTATTPWSGLATQGAGWCVGWSDYPSTLATALTTPTAELAAMGQRGRAWVQRDFSWVRAAALLAEFYRELLNGRR